jgi:hypothetical protein
MRNLLALSALLAGSAYAAEHELVSFKKTVLTKEYWSEASAFGDFNNDGRLDVASGPFWYEGPDFKRRHAYAFADQKTEIIRPSGARETLGGFDGALGTGKLESFSDTWYLKGADFNGDGWTDLLSVGLPPGSSGKLGAEEMIASWFENPGAALHNESQMWVRHVIAHGVDNESIVFEDVFGDGEPVLLAMSGGEMGRKAGRAGYFKPDNRNPLAEWQFHPISWGDTEFQWYTHGLGYGDLNGDGRADIVHSEGWWAQPAPPDGSSVWPYQPYPFNIGRGQVKVHAYGREPVPSLPVALLSEIDDNGIATPITIFGGSQMNIYDVNGDGLPDVVNSLAAHGYGLVWWEQLRSTDPGKWLQFRRHFITNKLPSESRYGIALTQMQSVATIDVNGDGLKDIVTGKRFWGHGCCHDPGSNEPAVLYWFELTRLPNGAVEFIPHLIDGDSGAGHQISFADVNGDRRPDITVANKKGAYLFVQVRKKVSEDTWRRARPKVEYPDVSP